MKSPALQLPERLHSLPFFNLDLTVIVPTHDPDLRRFRATLEGLRRQTLPPERWCVFIVDNASHRFPLESEYADVRPPGTRILHESQLGLSAARRRGFHEARTPFLVLVDDDNVLAPDYLVNILAIFQAHPLVGLAGGKTLPGFDAAPPAWTHEFHPLLALRDLGHRELVSENPRNERTLYYPAFAPLGAGLAARAAAIEPWLSQAAGPTDRRGGDLGSSGDNDIVLCALRAGWRVGYFPQLQLDHLIPPGRLDPAYLARLNRGIQKSWMEVLNRHGANPWPSIPPWTVRPRQLKAWFTHRGWLHPAGYIRWQGACGHFEGRVRSADVAPAASASMK